MDTRGVNNPKLGSDSQDSDDLHPPGTSSYERSVIKFSTKGSKSGKPVPKGVENAKKRLRAFSIQKKSSLSPVSVPKPVSTGGATVYIGKLSSVKTAPKPEPDPAAELKKLLKPPKPGAGKLLQESYIITQKKTLAEIEDMKRKMELVELGIPLGLICPAPNSDKAMPTKAMPPIKTFLGTPHYTCPDKNRKENAPQSHVIRKPRYIAIHAKKVDELIREAKKARAEGKEFKFDYHKLLPDYDNPFQRKKDEVSEGKPAEQDPSKIREEEIHRRNENIKSHARKVLSYNFKQGDKFRHREDKYKEKPKEKDDRFKDSERVKDKDVKARNREFKPKPRDTKSRDRDLRSKERDYRSKERAHKKGDKNDPHKTEIEAEVNLKDFVVCDSWSDNEDKSRDSTPKQEEKQKPAEEVPALVVSKVDPMEQLRQSLGKKEKETESLKPKIKRLNPVIDSFKFEIEDPDDDDVLDVYDEHSTVDDFATIKPMKDETYDSPIDMKLFEDLKDETFDEMADDTFLESVINEIKQEELDETSQDKGLVEYDESPREDEIRESVTPEMDDRVRELHSSRSDYSDGHKSLESGYKSTDSLKLSENYKSDSEVVETHVEERKMAKYTEDSLETWSFVLKICQPLLFRHDKNKCYKETRMAPKLWYTENPKLCSCVKDRRVVYKELEMCKMELVDSLCSGERVQESAYPTARGWYPHPSLCLVESSTVSLSSEWEAEDSQSEQRPATPGRTGDISLDKEYQRFMEAVWPEVAEPKSETPHSTPVRCEPKKQDDDDQDIEKRKSKKLKRGSEGWSQESEVEAEVEKSANKKTKAEKQKRKRKLSTSASVTDSSETEAKKRKKMLKKKDGTKLKSKEAKRRHVIKKNIKKLKDKQKKKKKLIKLHEELELQQDLEKEKKKKEKKIKKKKQLKEKKRNQKKKKAKAKSSSDTSTDSEAEQQRKSKKKKKKSSEKKKKRKDSSSESTQEELFDVNILNNIKTERVTDDEMKQLEFSPRRQKPREIINVKELQNDFVGNSIQVKQEVEEQKPVEEENVQAEGNVEVAAVEEQEEKSQKTVAKEIENDLEVKHHQSEFKEQEESQSTPSHQLGPDESNLSHLRIGDSSITQHRPDESSLSQLRPGDSSLSQHRPDESSLSQLRPGVSSLSQYKPDESSLSQLRLGDSSLSQLRPDESRLSQLRSGDSSLSQLRPDQSNLSQLRLDESYLSQLRPGDSNLSQIRSDMSNLSQLRPDESSLSQVRPEDSNLSQLRPDESSLSQLRPDDSSLSQLRPDESNLSQCSSQESIYSLKDQPLYEKDDSHLRPSSQNSNYSFHDVMASGMYSKSIEHGMEQHDMLHERHAHDMQSRELDMQSREHEMQSHGHDMQSHGHDMQGHDDDLDSQENYEQGDYEMYEHMAMAYQSDVASQRTSPPTWGGERRIETVVRSRTCGEIKCDWRAGDSRAKPPPRPSRWGLKPGEVNIVLTGGTEQYPIRNVVEPVYKIQSIANRTDNSNTGYDEAYMDMYGALDKLQYGDCFSTATSEVETDPRRATITKQTSSLDDRISLALRTTVLGNVAKDVNEPDDKDGVDKGILVTKSLAVPEGRGVKRVTFADGYKPGQDSDVEEPPVKKRKKPRRVGTAWPCPASHPDHVPLWDALPPPPPPAGSPPPAPAPPPPALHLLRRRPPPGLLPAPPHAALHKFDPNSMPAFMPPEPPPGLISFQNL